MTLTPASSEHDESPPASRLALWLPVVVSGVAVATWMGILAWLAYGR
jgi:hypothetical protein